MSDLSTTLLETVKESVQYIDEIKNDNEAAHEAEDRLCRIFIEHVAELNLGEVSEIAKVVLTTNDIDFERWYA